MLRKLRPRSAYDVCAALALFLVVSGGTAWAVNEYTGANIVDESLTGADVQNLSLTTNDYGVGSVWGSRIKDNGVFSSHVAPNSLTGFDIDEQTFTAPLVRAFVRVSPSTCTGTPPNETCAIDRSKGVTSVKRVDTGEYCVRAPAVSSQNVPAAATADFDSSTLENADTLRVGRGNVTEPFCDLASDFKVFVGRLPVEAHEGVFFSGLQVPTNDAGFHLLIP